MNGKIHLGDCLDLMAAAPADSFDICITDPPYNVGIDFGEGKDADRLDEEAYIPWLRDRLREAARLCKNGIVYFPGKSGVWRVPRVLEGLGLEQPWLLGWHKREFAGDLIAKNRPVMCWEPIVWARKGTPELSTARGGRLVRDFLVVNTHRQETGRVGHPTPKPTEVMSWLVGLFTKPGEHVLDPFGGSGTTGLVCERMGRHWTLIEKNCDYGDLALRRILADRPLLRGTQHELRCDDGTRADVRA